jgi:hypothetical protein
MTNTYDTRAQAIAATIPVSVENIVISREAAGYRLSNAPYRPGTAAGPRAFQEAGGHWWELELSGPVVESLWFGTKGDGVADDSNQLEDALRSWSNGKGVRLTGLSIVSRGILVRATGIRVFADSWGASTARNGVKIADGVPLHNGIFQIFDNHPGDVTFDNLYAAGNAAETNSGSSVGFLYVAPSQLSTGDMQDLGVRNCLLFNFRQNHWIAFEHAAQAENVVNIRRIKIHHNTFLSLPGNATPGFANAFIFIQPNNALTAPTLTGSIFDVEVYNNIAMGFGVCSLVSGIGGIENCVIGGNTTYAMGNSCDGTLTAYTYMMYQSNQTRNVPRNISLVGNVGDIHHNFAAYFAGARKVAVNGNCFSGTFRPNSAAGLPWGTAICANGCTDFGAHGNTLSGNYGGIAVLQSSVPDGLVLANSVTGNVIESGVNSLPGAGLNPFGIMFAGDVSVTTDQQLLIGNNTVKVTGDVAVALFYIGGKIGPLAVIGNQLTSSYLGYYESASYTGSARIFSDNKYGGGLTNAAFIASSGSAPLTITDDDADFSAVLSGATNGYIVDSNVSLVIKGLVLRGKTNSGTAFSGIGARGSIEGLTGPGTTVTFAAAGSIGLAAPNWTGYSGYYVQNLAATRKVGTSPNAYTLKGWNWETGTVWTEDRTGLF